MHDDICRCGQVIAQPQTGRRRQWCHQCSPPDRRRERHEVLQAQVVQLPMREPDDAPTLVSYARQALEQAGMADTWQGMSAIRLAELIDAAKHGTSGAAGNTKAFRESMLFALQQSPEGADIIDILFASDS
jgi:hypothetical protein